MSINNLSWEQVENPSKTKFKQLYLNKYRIKLGLFSNHKEQLPKSVLILSNSLETQTQKYFNQRIRSSHQT
ncbi:unnamed protein product (macronuclear) [Paramecium tetraurelia]|uniref:Uncharacterized protein n=1 Tax=Paramecium tetraurelia TaxID=5888 RepID=A0CX37_PARTE|nr:uncharacterized protein GSPATT00001558001 [Paramecium tetraurelia]CAK75354.1 unnamed protein product [Paramecium tetraurelia]|eukprot:XP_001442751.1 hypothetical protein (macronuclear) [Paramecium tetraurelia strain d4-2]